MRFTRRNLFAAVAGTLAAVFGAKKAPGIHFRNGAFMALLDPSPDEPPGPEMVIESIDYENRVVSVQFRHNSHKSQRGHGARR